MGKSTVGEEGPRSSGEHRGHPARVRRGSGVPDGVDATVLTVEPSRCDASAQLVLGDVAVELPGRHPAMLGGGQPGEGEICWSIFPARVT